ncbi:hypothetical protein [Actibacterium sp. D379-3]
MNVLEDGSIPMTREDEEAFSRFVVFESMTFQDAFIESRPGPRPERSDSARVQASRMAKRTEARRAFLAKQKAAATAPVEVSTDPQSILLLMDQVSAALLQASKVAKAHGADRLANTLRQSLTRHVGRHSRVSQRVENPGAVRAADEGDVERLARRVLEIEP